MKIVISGRTYQAVSVDEATLADLIALKAATGLSQTDLRNLGESAKVGDGDADDSLMLVGVLVWLTRRKAGERLTLEEACDVPLSEVDFIPEEGDDDESESTDPTSAAPKDSGRAAPRKAPADRRPSKKKTSSKASTSD